MFTHLAELPTRADVDDDERRGYCRFCKRNVRIGQRDCGIGAYEYWGHRGVHHDWRDCCTECGEECSEGERLVEEEHTEDL